MGETGEIPWFRRKGDWVRPARGEGISEIEGTILIPVISERRNYRFDKDEVTKVLSVKPLETQKEQYDKLIAEFGHDPHLNPDVFSHLGMLRKPESKFGEKKYASVSPVVVNLTTFQHPFDYTDLIPISVTRAKHEIRQFLENGHWVETFIYRESINKATQRNISLNAQIVAMKAALYEGKLERYLQLYDVLFPLDDNGKPVDDISAYERSINNETLDKLIQKYGSPIDKIKWRFSKSIDFNSLRAGLVRSGYISETTPPQLEASNPRVIEHTNIEELR